MPTEGDHDTIMDKLSGKRTDGVQLLHGNCSPTTSGESAMTISSLYA